MSNYFEVCGDLVVRVLPAKDVPADFFEKKGILTINEEFSIPDEDLRFNGKHIVSPYGLTEFYIDSQGTKHIVADSSYQYLACQFDDLLVFKSGLWTVKSDTEILKDAQDKTIKTIQSIANECRQQVTSYADQYETASWVEKARRAERAIAGMGTAADLAALQAEATARNLGETPEQLAQLQLKKANALHLKTAIIDGWVKAAGKQVSAIEDPTEAETLLISLKQNLDTQLAAIS